MQKLLDWLDSVPVDGFLLVGEKPKIKPPNEIRSMVLAGAQGLEP